MNNKHKRKILFYTYYVPLAFPQWLDVLATALNISIQFACIGLIGWMHYSPLTHKYVTVRMLQF